MQPDETIEQMQIDDGSGGHAAEPEYQEQMTESHPIEETEQEQESPQDRNWREMRQRYEEQKKQIEQLTQKLTEKEKQDEYLRQMQMMQQNQQYQQPQAQQDDWQPPPDDEVPYYRDVKRAAAEMAKKEVEKYIKTQESQNIPWKLQQQYPDYNEVVTQANVDKFCREDPELAQDINALQDDPLRMSRMLYKTLKARYGESKHEDLQDMAKKAQKQQPAAKQNAPMSSSAVPKRTALAEANAFAQGLTPDLKAQLWKEMQESEKMY